MSSAEAVGGGAGMDGQDRGGDRAGGTAQSLPPSSQPVSMEVDVQQQQAPDSNGLSSSSPSVPPSSSSLKHGLVRDDDAQPLKKQRTQPADERPLRVHIPSTPQRSPSHPPSSRPQAGATAELLRSQLQRLQDWQDGARAEMEALQRSLDESTPIALLSHPRPPVPPFRAVDAALTASYSSTPSAGAPGAPQSPYNASGGAGYPPLPSFYRSVTEPFHPPYSSAPSPMFSPTPSSFPFPSSSSLGSPTPTSVQSAMLSLEQLEARKAQLAAVISTFQKSAGALLPLGAEPPRNKTHWDYVLQEALWMSGDFQREKRWKLKVAKKISRSVLHYWARLKEKDGRERRAEVARRRKLCAAVAREVRKFWANIGKLVRYKHATAVEQEKKEAMQRHLEILVEETATYSTQLASTLTKASEAKEAPASPSAASPKDDAKDAAAQPIDDDDSNLDDILKGLNGGSPSSDGLRRSGRSGLRRPVAAGEEEGVDDQGDEDFDQGVSSEDDEETLEEEEEQEENDAGGDVDAKHEEEVNALNEEAEMSIEQLKAKYGIGSGAMDDDDAEDDASATADEDDAAQDDTPEAEDDGDDDVNDKDDAMADDDAAVPDSTDTSSSPVPSSSSSPPPSSSTAEEARITAAASLASSAQPTGYTLSTHNVQTVIPFLLRGTLREYQAVGLDWLASMYSHSLNGILADEMGLGKTIMTIALLGWLACVKEVWGQHLIVVPTSVMINWEMEFKRWMPAFRILCYHGSAKERKEKRRGWMDPNRFHVCITSYQVLLQDALIFKRKRWVYLVSANRPPADAHPFLTRTHSTASRCSLLSLPPSSHYAVLRCVDRSWTRLRTSRTSRASAGRRCCRSTRSVGCC